MSSTLPARRAAGRPVSSGLRGWRALTLSLATALALGLAAPQAQALSLGRVAVQSALGEPLRAEIDIPQITPDEVSTLRTALGSPEAFRAAGMERSPALADLQISLQQRPNGSYFLRLASDRAVTEPFIDLILEASAPTGRIVREYTLLFDPPSLRQAAPAAPPTPLPAQITPAAPPTAAAETPTAAAPVAAPGAAASAPVAAAPASTPASTPAAAAAPASAPKRRLTVQSGQTAAAIAAAAKPSTVSLDQMLVALLRTNPEAFIGDNVNRLKAGAVLELPTEAQAAAVGTDEARQTVVAQSKDFNDFKQRLAAGVTERPATGSPAGRAATGQVQARVEEKKPAPAASDRLTLSKGAVEEGARDNKASEDRIARERAEREAASRAAEIDRNIAELKRLGTESASLATPPAAAASTAASAASAPAEAAGIAVPSTLAAPGAAADAASAAASTPAAPASTPASSPAAPAATAREDGGLMDLLAHPMLPIAVGGLLALLLGFALYRRQQQARQAAADTGPGTDTDRLPPDSFFGGSGGQRIDTSEPGNSMLYSPSQIDAAGDVDPVAEADVYLAYGRDLQAEEILREALRTTPQRVAIHAKLLEILARRQDADAFEDIAREAHALTGGTGPQWAQIASLGLELDPGNPLYSGSGSPATVEADDLRSARPPAPSPAPVPAPAVPAGLDLDVDSFKPRVPSAAEAAGSPFDFSDEEAAPPAATKATTDAMDFDLAGLSLDLDTPAANASGLASADALATKLSLAEEFHAIGDADGARSLVQEVLAEAYGDLRRRAERLLAELG